MTPQAGGSGETALEANRAALAARHPALLRFLNADVSTAPASSEGLGGGSHPQDLSGVAEASLVLVFGLGDGRLLDAVREAASPGARIVVVVLDPGAIPGLLGSRDCSAGFLDPRVEFLAGPLRAIVAALPPPDGTMTALADPSAVAASAPELRPLADMARELDAARRSRTEQWSDILDNIENNLPTIATSPHAGLLREALNGAPAVLIAPGPSLERQIPLLMGRRLPLVAALDTSLRALAHAGIRPDLAFTLDPTRANLAKFREVPMDLPLVFFAGARPEAIRRAMRPVFACEADDLLDRAHPFFGRGGRHRSDGTVLLAALDVLLSAGCDPIVLVGADLALTGGKTHAGPSTSTPASLLRVQGKDGRLVATTGSLWRHRRRLIRRLGEIPEGRVLDATVAGASLPNCRRIDLAEWCAAVRGVTPPTLAEVVARERRDPDRWEAMEAARRALRAARALR